MGSFALNGDGDGDGDNGSASAGDSEGIAAKFILLNHILTKNMIIIHIQIQEVSLRNRQPKK